MITAILIAFLAPLCYAWSNILDSHVSNNLFKKNSSIIFYLGLTNIIILPFLAYFGWDSLLNVSNTVIVLIIIAALLDIGYQVPYFLALKKIDASIISAMFSLTKILLPLLAWLMVDEKLYFSQYIGFIIIILATLVLNIKRTATFKVNSAFFLMLIASLMTVFNVVIGKKALLEINWIVYAFWVIVVTDIFVLSFLFAPKIRREICEDFKIFKRKIKLLLCMEILDRMGSLSSVFALSLLPVVVQSAISSTQPIVVLFYGFILYQVFGQKFKENFEREHMKKKLICFLFIILGVILTIK